MGISRKSVDKAIATLTSLLDARGATEHDYRALSVLAQVADPGDYRAEAERDSMLEEIDRLRAIERRHHGEANYCTACGTLKQ